MIKIAEQASWLSPKIMKHKYKIGDLVELDGGARLFIADLVRDRDQTPLYTLTYDKDDGYYQVGSWADSDLTLIAHGE